MDIQKLIDMAKERLLEDGYHAPILFAENRDSGISLYHFADLPETTHERQIALFGLGREHGINSPGNPLVHLYFVHEAWTSYVKEGEKAKYDAPSQDPNHKEVLAIQELDAGSGKMSMYTTEIVRVGDTVDLLPVKHAGESYNKLLYAFLAGTASAKMSDRELAEMITKLGTI